MPWIGKPGKPGEPSDQCRETAGFLFTHPCDRTAIHGCQSCNKPICVDHTRLVDARRFCITCARDATALDDRDPFFYGHSYYGHSWYHSHGPSYDSNDFTEGDASNLQSTGDATFEDDLDAS